MKATLTRRKAPMVSHKLRTHLSTADNLVDDIEEGDSGEFLGEEDDDDDEEK